MRTIPSSFPKGTIVTVTYDDGSVIVGTFIHGGGFPLQKLPHWKCKVRPLANLKPKFIYPELSRVTKATEEDIAIYKMSVLFEEIKSAQI